MPSPSPSAWSGSPAPTEPDPAYPELDDFSTSPWGHPNPTPPPTRRVRYELLVGGPLLAVLLIVVLVLLLGSEPDELPVTAREPAPTGAPVGEVVVELAQPVDRTDHVELTWHSTRDRMDYAVIVAAEGESEVDVKLAERKNSMTVPVEPGRRYCFLVQASDSGGERVYESEPQPLRGATCSK